MTDGQVAIVISLLALVGQALNAWLKERMRGDLAEFAERLDDRYVRKEVCESERARLEQLVTTVSCQARGGRVSD